MTPFQQFRRWARRAPAGTRVAALLATILVMGLLAYAVRPVRDSRSASTLGGPAAVPAPTGATGAAEVGGTATTGVAPAAAQVPAGTGGTAGQAPAGAAAAAPSANGPKGCTSPPGSDKGITATEIKIVISLSDLGGAIGNSAFGIATAAEQRRAFEVAIAAQNAAGGVACRKLVAQYFTTNTLDQSQQQKTCLDAVQSQPVAVIDIGAFYTPVSAKYCFATQGVPFFAAIGLTEGEVNQHYPYLLSTAATAEQVTRHTFLALKGRGFFDPARGFRKLGVLYHDCTPSVNRTTFDQLRRAGVADAAIVTYNLGCPEAFSSPADIQQAILKFRQNGVTHLTFSDIRADFANFTKQAQQQGFRPAYGFPDEAQLSTSNGGIRPDADNLDGAIAITPYRNGEQNTTFAMNPGTAKCDAIQKAAGLRPVRQQQSGIGGVACSDIWMLTAAIEHAPALRRNALADGLHAAKSVELSFPSGPNDFTAGPRVTTGGQFWRAAQFFRSCACWKPLAPAFARRFG